MAPMSLEKEITMYLPQLDIDQQQSLLSVIKSFLKRNYTSSASPQITLEDYNKAAYDALERVKNGQFYTHEEIEEMSKEW